MLVDLDGMNLTFRDADSRKNGWLPSREDAEIMRNIASGLEDALKAFGGSRFNCVSGFWTTETRINPDDNSKERLVYFLYGAPYYWLDCELNDKAECRLISRIPNNN